jgi:hypothetical protein
MGRKTILIGVDGDSVHRELMRRTEHTNRNFLYEKEKMRQQYACCSCLLD